MLILSAAAEPQAGWGKLVALVGTALAFWAFTAAYKRYQEVRKAASANPSRATPSVTPSTPKPQLTGTPASNQGGPGVATAVVVRPATRQPRPIDEFVAQRLNKMPTSQIVREAKQVLKISDSTAWAAISQARKNNL